MLAVLAPFESAARAIRAACARADSPAAVAARFEAGLAPWLATHGRAAALQNTGRRVWHGQRPDAPFAAVVMDYHAELAGPAAWAAATARLMAAIEAIAPPGAGRDAYVGLLTDGRSLGFVTFCAGAACAETPGPLDGPRLRRAAETLVALGQRALTPTHLVEDFAGVEACGAGLGRALALACYAALGQPAARTGMLQGEWQRLFAQALDQPHVPIAQARAYRRALALPEEVPVEAARALFALQSAYAIGVKLVAARVLGGLPGAGDRPFFERLAGADDATLRECLAELEDGQVARACGFENLIEGDVFAWYAAAGQWTPAIARAVRAIVQRLAEYEGRGPWLRPGAPTDLFRALYQQTIPADIRHALGEYYTPRWLAQAVIAELPAPSGWRGLDPCCGSGTFLIELIAEVLAESTALPGAQRLRAVTERVQGIDLNPLAVLTARVNYFLAIAGPSTAPPGRGDPPIVLPVYLGDAAAEPLPVDLDGVPALAFSLPTVCGPLTGALPTSLVRRGPAFGQAMRAVAAALAAGEASRARAVLDAAIGAEARLAAVDQALDRFIDALAALERQGGQGLGTRAITNTLAADALGLFERVAGNPPWVEWKDLPAGYRESVNDRCRSRGLLGVDAYAGGTDLNLCALIAHSALERFVRPGGHLAFLMPHSLLHTRAAQGFRRWRLPGGEPLALRALADWQALKPFDAACHPVSYLIARGQPGPASVPVRIQRGARPPAHASWREVGPTLTSERLAAHAVDTEGGPYMIEAPDVLPALLALLGPCAYRGRRATETSPHGVYWVRPVARARAASAGALWVENALNPRAKATTERAEAPIEHALLYPLLRGSGIAAFRTRPDEALVILPHSEASGARALAPEAMPPLALAYLTRHQAALERRGSYREYRRGEPFYGLWRVGPYTFAPYKVVWPEMGELRAAVISSAATPWGERKLLIPEGKVNLVGCSDPEEAHFLCAWLNAPLVRRAYACMSSQIGRPSRLPFALPAFDARRYSHRALAAVSRAAHAHELATGRADRLLGYLVDRARRPVRLAHGGVGKPSDRLDALRSARG